MGLQHSLLALLLLAAAGLAAAEGSRRHLSSNTAGPAIVGGTDVPLSQRNRYPYFTSLREAITSYHFCGATLIAPRILLTAAHCVTESGTSAGVLWGTDDRVFAKARVGPYETYPVPAVPGPYSYEQRQVIAAAVHRDYDSGTLYNDIALLLLDRASFKAPMPLPAGPVDLQQRAPVGAKMLSIGFGMSLFQDEVDNTAAQAYERVLQQLWMTRQPYSNGGTFVMAGNPPNWLSDTWKGDSGGPLFLPNGTDASGDMQFGIVSNGMPGQPGAYTNVALFAAWIARGKQLLLDPNGEGQFFRIKRAPVCAATANYYCVHCGTGGERLTCVDSTPCIINSQGQTQLLMRCSELPFEPGRLMPSGCYDAVQYLDRTGYGQGPAILGRKPMVLRAALGAQRPNDTYPSCPVTAPFVLKACPGAASVRACVPGAGSLSGTHDGCCACRKTRVGVPLTMVYPAAPVSNTYYGSTPSCLAPDRALLAGTVVHYTGALLTGNPRLGCQQKKYAQVVMEVLAYDGTGLAYETFYVEADKLVPCDDAKSCTELGGNCQDAPGSCCKLAGQGGAPAARCAYPPEIIAPSACVRQ